MPTAAAVGVSGTAATADGRPIARAVVSLTDTYGVTKTTRTNAFGVLQFEDVAARQSYTVTASAKGYPFDALPLSVADETAGLNLVGR